jgi:hypothetical protein
MDARKGCFSRCIPRPASPDDGSYGCRAGRDQCPLAALLRFVTAADSVCSNSQSGQGLAAGELSPRQRALRTTARLSMQPLHQSGSF